MTLRRLRHALDDSHLPARAFGSVGKGGTSDEEKKQTDNGTAAGGGRR